MNPLANRFTASVRMSAYYGAALFSTGVVMPFFPAVLDARGLSGGDIATVLAIPHLARVAVIPLLTRLVDRSQEQRHAPVLVGGLLVLAAVAVGLVDGLLALMAVAAVLLTLMSTLGPLADAIAVSMDRRGEGDYGRMRLWGSATFILGNVLGGYVLDHHGVAAVEALIVAAFVLALVAGLVVPPAPPPAAAMAEAAEGFRLRGPALLMLLAAALVQASHAGLYAFATLVWQARGYSEMLIGVFWAAGVIAEIVLFAFARHLPPAATPARLILAGGLIGAVRWSLYTVDTGAAATLVLQAAHAGSFALCHMGMMRYIRQAVPAGRSAAATGAYGILVGLSMATATVLGGLVWSGYGERAFLAMSAFCLAGLAVLAFATRCRPPVSAGR